MGIGEIIDNYIVSVYLVRLKQESIDINAYKSLLKRV